MALLRLDPRHPIVWRTPGSLQIGGRRPIVVLDGITPAEERMVHALGAGIPEEALAVQGRCARTVAAGLIERVRPALLGATPPGLAITVRTRDDQGRQLAELARSLGLLGVQPADARAGRTAGMLIGSHAIPPVAYRDWLRRDVPHIGIIFGESEVHISSVVVPGHTPCLRCADLHRRDADACWPAIATQLLAVRAAAADDPLLRVAALATAVRRLREVCGAPPSQLESRALSITADGTAAAVAAPSHDECGCLVDLQHALPSAA